MKDIFRLLLLAALISFGAGLTDTGLQAQSRKAKRAEALAEKKKEQQKKEYLISQDKDRQRRQEMQTPKNTEADEVDAEGCKTH